jgi:hypothetical protein
MGYISPSLIPGKGRFPVRGKVSECAERGPGWEPGRVAHLFVTGDAVLGYLRTFDHRGCMHAKVEKSGARKVGTAMRCAGAAIAATIASAGMTAPPAPTVAAESSPTTALPVTPLEAPTAELTPFTPLVLYMVVPGDSLSLIAATHGLDMMTGWRLIYDANSSVIHPDLIFPGMILRIPAPDEQVPPRALPTLSPPRAAGGGSGAAPRASSASHPSAPASAGGGVWDRLAQCESSGNWSSTVGHYDGGLQFDPATWTAYGGGAYAPTADRATREQQIAIAQRVLASQGWGAWPACSRKLGLR